MVDISYLGNHACHMVAWFLYRRDCVLTAAHYLAYNSASSLNDAAFLINMPGSGVYLCVIQMAAKRWCPVSDWLIPPLETAGGVRSDVIG